MFFVSFILLNTTLPLNYVLFFMVHAQRNKQCFLFLRVIVLVCDVPQFSGLHLFLFPRVLGVCSFFCSSTPLLSCDADGNGS